MSELLENLKVGNFYENVATYQLSAKVLIRHQAMLNAIQNMGLPSGTSKTDALRFLLDLGWEAIENDSDFSDLVESKEAIEEVLVEQYEEIKSNL